MDSSLDMGILLSEARPVAKVVEAVCERSEQAGTTSAAGPRRVRLEMNIIKC